MESNEIFSRGFDAGNYDSAYNSEVDGLLCGLVIASAKCEALRGLNAGAFADAQRADIFADGYVLGFFSTYETSEVPPRWRSKVATLRRVYPEA